MRGVWGGLVLLVVGMSCLPASTRAEPPVDGVGLVPGDVLATEGIVNAAETVPLGEESAPARPAEDAAAASDAEAKGLAVRDVKVESTGNGRRVRIELTQPPDGVKDFALESPPRLVFDVAGPRAGAAREARFPLADDEISRVRVAPYRRNLRIVIDMSRDAGRYTVRQEGNVLVADLGGTITADAAQPAADAARPDPTEAAPPAALPLLAPMTVVPEADTGAAAAAAEPMEVAQAPEALPPPPPPPPPARRAARPPADVRYASAAVPARADIRPTFSGQRISLDFKDADVQNVLRVIADVSGMNIIATDDVKGKVTLHLQDVPWDQALDLVLRSNRLEKTQDGNVVRVSTVNRLREEREALRAADEAAKELEPLRVGYVRVNYARADDALIDKVKGVLTDRGSVTYDDRTNMIIIRDITRGIQDATELIRQLDVQSPQVLIEAQLVEADETMARALGIQWGYNFQAGPLTGNPTGVNFPGTVNVGGSGLGVGGPVVPTTPGVAPSVVPFLADFPVPGNFGPGFGAGAGSALNLALGSIDGAQSLAARLTALEEEGKAKVISRPRVVTMNNVAATIESLDILRVKLPSTGTVINTGAGGAAGTATVATEKINTGIILVVTPQVSADGYVLMNIFAKASRPDFSRTVEGIPAEISRQANSNVLVRDGETVVLGGIFLRTAEDRETGIPFLMHIPAIGWLFKRNLSTNRHAELLVFVTPKSVVTGGVGLPTAGDLWQQRRRGG